jgi:hypothetical protein
MVTGIGFTDALPVGLVISTPNGLVNTCGGTIAAVAGSNNIGLSGRSAQANSTCSLSVNITATGIGHMTNTTSAITSSGGTGTPATPNQEQNWPSPRGASKFDERTLLFEVPYQNNPVHWHGAARDRRCASVGQTGG